jgi:hypothetical protein
VKKKPRPAARGPRAPRARAQRPSDPVTRAGAATREHPAAVTRRHRDFNWNTRLILRDYADINREKNENDRRAALARWSAERAKVATDLRREKLAPARRQEAAALVKHIDAALAELRSSMIDLDVLLTLDEPLAAYRHPGRGFDDVSKVVRAFLANDPDASMPAIRDHLRDLALRGDPVILALGTCGSRARPVSAVGLERISEQTRRRLTERAVAWRDQDRKTEHVLRDDLLVKLVKRQRPPARAARSIRSINSFSATLSGSHGLHLSSPCPTR